MAGLHLLDDIDRIDHEVKGQALYCFVTLTEEAGRGDREAIKKALVAHIRSQIGAFAVPEKIHWAPGDRDSLTQSDANLQDSHVCCVVTISSCLACSLPSCSV